MLIAVGEVTLADHDRLNQFTEEISGEELNNFFWFSGTNHQAIDSIRGDYNLLRFALQLGCLRYLSFFSENLLQIPYVVVQYVAQQSDKLTSKKGSMAKAPRNNNNIKITINRVKIYDDSHVGNIAKTEASYIYSTY